MNEQSYRLHIKSYAKGMRILEERCAQLEQLCRDLAGWIAYTTLGGKITAEEYADIENKLHDAGLGME